MIRYIRIMYPLVLNAEEVYCLRVMLKVVVTIDILNSAKAFRADILAKVAQDIPIDPAVMDGAFARRFLGLNEMYRLLDQPLFQGDLLLKATGERSVVVNVNKEAFDGYRDLLTKNYGAHNDPSSVALYHRITAAQPAIRAALEVAEEQQRIKVTVNVPAAPGRQ